MIPPRSNPHSWTTACVLGLALLAAGPVHAQAPATAGKEIDVAEVRRILGTLASDEMEGRASFTPASDRAAAFIAAEFEAAGLRPMEGAKGFLRPFPVYSISAGAASVTVDGTELPREDVLVRLSSADLTWGPGDVTPLTVGPDDNAQEVLLGRLRSGEGGLIFLHPAHRELLRGRLGSFLSGPVNTLTLGDTPPLVVVVTGADDDAPFHVRASARIQERTLTNVAGTIPGRRGDEVVLFSAHYDHVGIRPGTEGDSIYNGANDNASGTTAVILLARRYAAQDPPERTLVFVAFAAEESGGYGSRHFSRQLDPDRIVAMFNIEMIGKPAVEGPNTAWITGFERSSFGPILQAAVEGTGYAFHPDPYPEQNLFYRSDNATLARLGVPAHTISTTPIDVDPDYHRPSDEISTLNLEHLTNTVKAIALGARSIVAGEATPTRVDPATVR